MMGVTVTSPSPPAPCAITLRAITLAYSGCDIYIDTVSQGKATADCVFELKRQGARPGASDVGPSVLWE